MADAANSAGHRRMIPTRWRNRLKSGIHQNIPAAAIRRILVNSHRRPGAAERRPDSRQSGFRNRRRRKPGFRTRTLPGEVSRVQLPGLRQIHSPMRLATKHRLKRRTTRANNTSLRPTRKNSTRKALLNYFKLLYGDKGQKLLKAFEKAGGVINPKNVWFAKSRLNVRLAFGPLEIGIDDALNLAEAAQQLMERLLEASSLTEVRQHLSHSGFKNIEALIDSYRQSFKQAAATVALAAELYLSGISIVNEGADWVLTFHELSEGNYYAAIAFLPLIPAAVGNASVVLKHGKQTIHVSAEAIRKIKALPVDELIELLESTRNLARNMEKAGITRPANTTAHHIVPVTLKKLPGAEEARAILVKFGIGLENAANGVYLPTSFDDAVKAANHGSVHTKKYYEELLKRLDTTKSKEDVLIILDAIRKELLTGKFPH